MTTAPVIAGLAIGIGFVVLFAVMFNAAETCREILLTFQ